MHKIDPPMTSLKNDINIEKNIVFAKNYFYQWRHLWWRHPRKTKSFEKLCDCLQNEKFKLSATLGFEVRWGSGGMQICLPIPTQDKANHPEK